MTLNGVTTADARFLCGSSASHYSRKTVYAVSRTAIDNYYSSFALGCNKMPEVCLDTDLTASPCPQRSWAKTRRWRRCIIYVAEMWHNERG